jgi:hypothetical protein
LFEVRRASPQPAAKAAVRFAFRTDEIQAGEFPPAATETVWPSRTAGSLALKAASGEVREVLLGALPLEPERSAALPVVGAFRLEA